MPNLGGVDLRLRCAPSSYLTVGESAVLCRKLTSLFETQGARVRNLNDLGGLEDDEEEEALLAEDGPPREAGEEPIELEVEVKSRLVNRDLSRLFLSIASFTAVPMIREETFAQDITVRGRDGFLLLQESLQGRIVARGGVGIWAGNGIVQLFRSRKEREARKFKEALSADLYGRMSQVVFDARIRAEVLQTPRTPRGP